MHAMQMGHCDGIALAVLFAPAAAAAERMATMPAHAKNAIAKKAGSTKAKHGARHNGHVPAASATQIEPMSMPMPQSPAPSMQTPMDHSKMDHSRLGGMRMPMADHAGHGMAMKAALGPYPLEREASETAWQPDTTQHSGVMKRAGDWMLMGHGTLNLVYDHQGGPRGDDKGFASGMLMGMAQRRSATARCS
jgi:hypothetical protein